MLTWFHFHSGPVEAETYVQHHAGTHKQEKEYSVITWGSHKGTFGKYTCFYSIIELALIWRSGQGLRFGLNHVQG